MPISYKNKIYTTLGTPTVLSGNVVSATDNAGVPAKDYTVKGKTIVWNQLFDKNSIPNRNSTAITYSVDGNINILTTTNVIATSFFSFLCPTVSGHKYMICARSLEWNSPNHSNLFIGDSGNPDTASYATLTPSDLAKIFTATNETCYIKSYISYSAGNYEFKMNGLQLFDLTKMFGAGNEPATPEEFRAMFPDYYYSYNAGEMKSIIPTNIEASGIERFQLLDKNKYPATGVFDGVTYTNNGDGTITLNGTATATTNYNLQSGISVIANHKYFCVYSNIFSGSGAYPLLYTSDPAVFNTGFPMLSGDIITALKDYDRVFFQIKVSNGKTMTNMLVKPQLFDLTQMFGAGNEPATPAEFWQKIPEKLYGYNPSAYKSVNIPSSKYFPDGMRSAGSAYDEINFLSQKAIKRIGVVDMGEVNWRSNTGTYPTNSFYSSGFTVAKGNSTNIISNTSFKQLYVNSGGLIIVLTDDNEQYDSPEAFKAAMSGVMLYYELATPVETPITPPLQALPTYKGFTSFSAPNSLTQNGPMAVTYYAEGGANPESGWLTSYKRKLYMGRNIEWNQLLDKSKYPATATANGVTFTNNGDGRIVVNGTATSTASFSVQSNYASIVSNHKYLVFGCPKGGTNSTYSLRYNTNGFGENGSGKIVSKGDSIEEHNYSRSLLITVGKGVTCSNLVFKPQLFDLTQMFGAGNEPATPAEFWTYFDHKLYPYNPGETQQLFKISRKSQCGSKEVAMPNKGDIITMDGKDYRVLKINDKIAEVFCMYDANNSIAFDTNSDHNNTYAGKNIDTYCNSTFYNGLSAAIKTAIIDKTFTQDSWTRSSVAPTESHYTGIDTNKNLYYLTLANAAYGTSITRHCYSLSVQDVLDYLECTTSMGTSDTMLTDVNIWKMFWNVITSPGDKRIWLRSAYASNSDYAFNVHGSIGRLIPFVTNYEFAARPAFQIDLSKVEWTK